MFYFAIIAWLGGVVVSLWNGNRQLPLTILLIGIILMAASIMGFAGYFGIAGIALLAAIIWIANKSDMF